LVYVGSTCEPTLARRLAKHVGNYKVWSKDYSKASYTTSYKIIEGGNYDIILIEEIKCETKDQLHARERYYIESQECVNKFIPTRTQKEYGKIYREEHKGEMKEYQKDYVKNHKEDISIKQKQYYEKHREDRKVYNQMYRENHQQILSIKQKTYRELHKEELNVKQNLKYTCICGKVYTHCAKKRHEKSHYHQNYLKAETEINDENLTDLGSTPTELDELR
jgi:hypothetical protein